MLLVYEQFLLFGGDDKLFVNYLSSLELHLMEGGTTRTINRENVFFIRRIIFKCFLNNFLFTSSLNLGLNNFIGFFLDIFCLNLKSSIVLRIVCSRQVRMIR